MGRCIATSIGCSSLPNFLWLSSLLDITSNLFVDILYLKAFPYPWSNLKLLTTSTFQILLLLLEHHSWSWCMLLFSIRISWASWLWLERGYRPLLWAFFSSNTARLHCDCWRLLRLFGLLPRWHLIISIVSVITSCTTMSYILINEFKCIK
jgi:hypothetical protein